MFRRKVTSPDGRQWKLGRRWLPRRRRLGRADISDVSPLDMAPDFGDDLGIIGAIIVAVLAVIAAVVLVLVLFNVFAIAIELTILVVALLWGIVARVIFRRPWTVFAATSNASYTRSVVGWRASRREIHDMAARLQSGLEV